eukprot:UN08910
MHIQHLKQQRSKFLFSSNINVFVYDFDAFVFTSKVTFKVTIV